MKRTALAAIIAAFATTAQAQDTPMEICTAWGHTASLVMTSRQIGVPLSTTLSAWDVINDVQFQMVMDAYNVPRYRTPSIIAEVIEDFRNVEEHKCFSSFSDPA